MSQDLPASSLRTLIGAKAREARLRLGLTQEDVADSLGIATEVYGRLERGGTAPSVFTLRKLCLTLKLSADLALGTEPDHEKATEETRPGEEPAPDLKQTESKYLRRILRRSRRLTPHSLRLVSQLAAMLPAKPRVKPKPPRA